MSTINRYSELGKMIEREDLKYLKNIVDLQNKNVNYRTLMIVTGKQY